MPRVTKAFVIKDANIVSCNVLEDDYTLHKLISTYGLGDLVRVVGVDVHLVYRSVHGVTATWPSGNLGFNPLAELDLHNPIHWSLVDQTNKYRMFDNKVSSRTVNADLITAVLQGFGNMNTVSLLNITGAATASLEVKKIDGTVIYSQSKAIGSTAGRTNWWAYFFRPLLNKTSVNFNDIPPNTNSIITITLTGPGQNVGIGMLVIGNGVQFDENATPGNTTVDYGASTRNRDFSVREELSTGDYRFVKGPNSKQGTFTFLISKDYYDLWNNTVADIGAEPFLFTATNMFDSTNIFGIFEDADASIDYPNHCRVNVKIKGLI